MSADGEERTSDTRRARRGQSDRLDRMVLLDYLRVPAAFGIVWYHTPKVTARAVGHAAIPFFVATSFALLCMRDRVGPWRTYVGRRARRFLLPWVCWTAFYTCIVTWWAVRHEQPVAHVLRLPAMVIGTIGTSNSLRYTHLWYLPFGFLGSLLVFGAARLTKRVSLTVAVSAAVVLGAALLGWGRMARAALGLRPSPLWHTWLGAAPALPIGFALGRSCLWRDQKRRLAAAATIAGVTIAVAICLWRGGETLYAVSYGIGVPLVCVAFTVRVPRARMLGRLSELTLGVYLLHPVIVHVLYRFWSTEQSASWRAASAFSVACVLTAVLRSLPWVRRLV